MTTIKFPYYSTELIYKINKQNLKAMLTSNIVNYASQKNQEEIVKEALSNPIGSRSLNELVIGKRDILIITSDHTRPVPSKITLPILIDEIKKGNPFIDITILIATGLHRATTKEEQIDMFGEDIVNSYKIVVHDAFDEGSTTYICSLPSGASFEVNKLAIETELLIAEGFIEPHFFAGYSGGRKSILPGICSKTTVNENHSAKAVGHPSSRCGVLHGNIINRDMVYAARKVNLAFILNVALNSRKEIISAFSGDMELAHEIGCKFVDKHSKVKTVKGDIIITSNGGYPLDQNLYQCAKSVSTAYECANEDAVIILVASCTDGFGGLEFEKLMTIGTPKEIYEKIVDIPEKDTISEQWCAQKFAEILIKHKVIVVSTFLDKEKIEKANMILVSTIAEAMEIAMKYKGENAQIVAIPDGISTIIES